MDHPIRTPDAASANPLVPETVESVILAVALLHLVLWVTAVAWLLRRRDLDTGQRLLGLLLATALPVIGPAIAWWATGAPLGGVAHGWGPEQRSGVGNRSGDGRP